MKERLLLFVLPPFESVTVAETENVPDPVGEQDREAVFAEEQPVGKPDHAYEYPPDPPVADVEKVVLWPT